MYDYLMFFIILFNIVYYSQFYLYIILQVHGIVLINSSMYNRLSFLYLNKICDGLISIEGFGAV